MSDLNKNYYKKITFRDALRLAIHDSMQEDEKIIGTAQSPYLIPASESVYTLVLDLDETLVHYEE